MNPQSNIFSKGDLVVFFKHLAQYAPVSMLLANEPLSRGIVISCYIDRFEQDLVDVFVDDQIITFHRRDVERINNKTVNNCKDC